MENTLQEGHCVRNRWQVVRKIGQGAFGEVYDCEDLQGDRHVALKIVSKERRESKIADNLIKIEVNVLKTVQGKNCFPRFIAFGKTIRYDYLVMELMGSSLSELKRRQPEKKFSLSTTLRLGEMMLECIQTLHKAGYLHRDIKPSNFVMGLGRNNRMVYLVDFGLSRKFLSENGEVRPARSKASFQGTPRYASLNVLRKNEAGRQDDLMSLFYILSEFLYQDLPWKNIRDLQEVAQAKESFDHQILVREFPDEFEEFFTHISELSYEKEPNYDLLFSVFGQCIERRGVKKTDPYDFEVLESTLPAKSLKKANILLIASMTQESSDPLIVEGSSVEVPVDIKKEPAQSNGHYISKSQCVVDSYEIYDTGNEQFCDKTKDLIITNSKAEYSCKDTGFSASPPGVNSQFQTSVSISAEPEFLISKTDHNLNTSFETKRKEKPQFAAEPANLQMSQRTESIFPDSLLQENLSFDLNKTNNAHPQDNIFFKENLKCTSRFLNHFKGITTLSRLNTKVNKPIKEKRRHSVRRSVSQPARIPSRLMVKNVLNDPDRAQAQQGLPRCWSCPTISLFIRSDLKPPLKQQASFEENVYEVDVMRNVAAAKQSVEDSVPVDCRRNSLPDIFATKTCNEELPTVGGISEQNLPTKIMDTQKDIHFHQGHYTPQGKSFTATAENGVTSSETIENTTAFKHCSLVTDTGTKVRKSLSDSNVAHQRTVQKPPQNNYPIKNKIFSEKFVHNRVTAEGNTMASSIKDAAIVAAERPYRVINENNCEVENKTYSKCTTLNKLDNGFSSNFNVCKCPKYKNLVDNSNLVNEMRQEESFTFEKNSNDNNSNIVNNRDKNSMLSIKNHLKSTYAQNIDNVPRNKSCFTSDLSTSEEAISVVSKNCNKTSKSFELNRDVLNTIIESYGKNENQTNCINTVNRATNENNVLNLLADGYPLCSPLNAPGTNANPTFFSEPNNEISVPDNVISAPINVIELNNGVSGPNNAISEPNNVISVPNNVIELNNGISGPNNAISEPNNVISETNNVISESNSVISEPDHLKCAENKNQQQSNRRQRLNSDNKYVKYESELNLNFARRRQRPSSQIYEEPTCDTFSTFPSALLLKSQSNSFIPYELLQPPSDEPPPNHCLPSRRVRYRRALTSVTTLG